MQNRRNTESIPKNKTYCVQPDKFAELSVARVLHRPFHSSKKHIVARWLLDILQLLLIRRRGRIHLHGAIYQVLLPQKEDDDAMTGRFWIQWEVINGAKR